MDLTRLARRQHGVVSRQQALEAGLSRAAIRHRLDSQRWQRLHAGVYLTHSGAVSWTAQASAALLHAGAGATLGLHAAAFHSRMSAQRPAVIQVFVPEARRVVAAAGMDVRRKTRISSVSVEGLRVTGASQTVIDLAGEPDQSVDDVVALVTRACQQGRTTASGLLAELDTRSRHPRRELLQVALTDVGSGVESVAEFRFLTDVARRHGLPPLTSQAPTGDGGRRDFESAYGVIIEIDGVRWHQGAQLHRDRRRDRRAARDGKVTLRAGWADVALRPCELAVDIALVLRQRGWDGVPRACSPGCAVSRLRIPPR